jgi:hypothetical protein
MRKFIILAATALAVAACSSSSDRDEPPAPPANTAPNVSAIGDQAINQDTSAANIAFSVDDGESGGGALTISASSSDTSLLPESGIVLAGGGGARTLTLTPAESATGSATVMLTVTDPQGLSVTRSFQLTVNAVLVSFTNWTLDTYAVPENEPSRSMLGFTLNSDADDNDAAFSALLQ